MDIGNIITGREALLMGVVGFGGMCTSQALDNARVFDERGNLTYNLNSRHVGWLTLSALLAAVPIYLEFQDQNLRMEHLALNVALFSGSVLYSLINKNVEVLFAKSISKTDYSTDSLKDRAPYLVDRGLKGADGKELKMDYPLNEISLASNSFGIENGYLPQSLITNLQDDAVIRLFYKGHPVEIIPKNFKCTKLKVCQSLDKSFFPDYLRQADGSKIKRVPNERLIELEFSENPFLKKAYLPESLIDFLAPESPLELKYRGREILVTLDDKCQNSFSKCDCKVEFDQEAPYTEKELAEVLNRKDITHQEKDLIIKDLIKK